MNPIIRVDGISKQYHIGASGATRGAVRYVTLRESLVKAARHPIDRLRRKESDERIWALRGISFDVNPGEVVGIIGSNGSGKSTLLKVLSRITKPTTGRVELYGRVASLLEVGTGFHPDLTGTENVYLNGAILGMKRREIDRKFDEIVAFADIDKFLDTPVKHYSSGMYVRLAFAVAAHLDPDILIVDEVLAVGDLNFQKKCLGKMDDVMRSGRTVLFVSHSMNMIAQLCQRVLLLEKGSIATIGPADEVIARYHELCNLAATQSAGGHLVAVKPGGEPGVSFELASQTISAAGGDASVRVTSSPNQKWRARTGSSFLKILDGIEGKGPGTILFSVEENTLPSARRADIEIGGMSHTVYQAAAFKDVPETIFCYEEVARLSARGITSGFSDGSYRVADPLTREQLAVFIVRALGSLNPSGPPRPTFKDVTVDRFSFAYIEEMTARGLTVETDGARFCPEAPVTREQAAVLIMKAIGITHPTEPEVSSFPDVDPSRTGFAFIEEMARRGGIVSHNSISFRPDDYITRGEMAVMIVKAFNL